MPGEHADIHDRPHVSPAPSFGKKPGRRRGLDGKIPPIAFALERCLAFTAWSSLRPSI